jgi:hypothetical protein
MDTQIFDAEQVLVAAQDLSINQDGDVASVLHPESGKIFVVNQVGRRIIELCDGHHTVSGITAAISQEFTNATSEKVSGDVGRFLTQAVSKGLVTVPAK